MNGIKTNLIYFKIVKAEHPLEVNNYRKLIDLALSMAQEYDNNRVRMLGECSECIYFQSWQQNMGSCHFDETI